MRPFENGCSLLLSSLLPQEPRLGDLGAMGEASCSVDQATVFHIIRNRRQLCRSDRCHQLVEAFLSPPK